jgi:hypothetical protein
LWNAGRYCDDRGNKSSRLIQYVLFKRSNEEGDVQNIEASAKAEWEGIIKAGAQAKAVLEKSRFTFDLNATAWVSHSGCNIPTTGGATGSPGLSVTCNDVIEMAKSILSTEQPGWNEIALLAPYRWVNMQQFQQVPDRLGTKQSGSSHNP